MTAAWWTGFYHQRQGTWSFSAPFGRASPSVVNRLTKAGSLLTSTSPMLSVRAMPSVSRTATPVKPSAPWWTRTTGVSNVAVLQTAAIAAMHNEAKEQTSGIEPDNQKAVPTGLQVSPKKQMAQPYRRHRMGPAQETRMNKISRTIQTQHTIFRDSSTLKGSPAGFEPASHHAWSREPENHARLTLPQER